MHLLHDARRVPHVGDLGLRLHESLPVHEARRVEQRRLAEMGLQRAVRGGAEVVVVHLDADPRSAPAAPGDDRAQIVHRVALAGHHVVVRVAHDVVVRHEHGALRPVGVHAAPEPHRIACEREEHALVHVEGPAVVAGQPRHVRGVGDDEQVEPSPVHRAAGLRDPRRVFVAREGEFDRRGRVAFAARGGGAVQGPRISEGVWSFHDHIAYAAARDSAVRSGGPGRLPAQAPPDSELPRVDSYRGFVFGITALLVCATPWWGQDISRIGIYPGHPA